MKAKNKLPKFIIIDRHNVLHTFFTEDGIIDFVRAEKDYLVDEFCSEDYIIYKIEKTLKIECSVKVELKLRNV